MTRDRYDPPPDPRDRDEDAMLRAHHDRLEASAHPRPEFVDGLERQLLAPAPASRFRFRPAIAAVLLIGALVGGAIAGGIFQARDLANDPEPTPQPTLSLASPDPSETMGVATATASPTPTPSPSPSQAPTSTPSPTTRPTPTPSPTPVLAWRELTGQISVDRGIADSVVGDDGLLYTFLWGHEHVAPMLIFDPRTDSAQVRQVPTTEWVQVDAQPVVGPNGVMYLFQWGPHSTDIITFDPATQVFAAKPPIIPITVWDATRGPDGTIYVLRVVEYVVGTTQRQLEIHVYDPRTGTASLLAANDRLGAGMSLQTGPDGKLIVVGSERIATLDPSTGDWVDAGPTPDIGTSERRVTVDDRGRLLASNSSERTVEYFDGATWRTIPAPAPVGSITWVGSRWIVATLTPHLGHPSGVQYWEVTPVD